MTEKDDSTAEKKRAEAEAFWREHGKDVPPPELRDFGGEPEEYNETREYEYVPPPPRRVNATDTRRIKGYDDELGRVADETPAESEIPEDAAERWARMATDLASLFVQTSAYAPHVTMPIARLPELTELPHMERRLLEALPELEALHRKLCPDWRAIVLGWLENQRKANIEGRYRPEHDKKIDRVLCAMGLIEKSQQLTHDERWAIVRQNADKLHGRLPRVNTNAPRDPTSAQRLLETLRGLPHLQVPPGLSAEMLESIAPEVTQGGRAGGYTPAEALRLLEAWSGDPETAAAATRKKLALKDSRRTKKGRPQK